MRNSCRQCCSDGVCFDFFVLRRDTCMEASNFFESVFHCRLFYVFEVRQLWSFVRVPCFKREASKRGRESDLSVILAGVILLSDGLAQVL